MGVILGTVPGWERDSDWTPGNRVYTAPKYKRYVGTRPPENIRHTYSVTFNIEIYIFDSGCDCREKVVERRINNINIIGMYSNEYIGGLSQWIRNTTLSEAEYLVSRSVDEMAGPPDCLNCDRYSINITDSSYIPPKIICPESVKDTIRFLEKQAAKATGTKKENIERRIKELKEQYNCP